MWSTEWWKATAVVAIASFLRLINVRISSDPRRGETAQLNDIKSGISRNSRGTERAGWKGTVVELEDTEGRVREVSAGRGNSAACARDSTGSAEIRSEQAVRERQDGRLARRRESVQSRQEKGRTNAFEPGPESEISEGARDKDSRLSRGANPFRHRPPRSLNFAHASRTMIDLDALRKAALSSKKRKLATQAAAESTSQLSPEKEEGEIDDDATLTAPAPVHASAACQYRLRMPLCAIPATIVDTRENSPSFRH